MPQLRVGFNTNTLRNCAILGQFLDGLGPRHAQSWRHLKGFVPESGNSGSLLARLEARLQPVDNQANLPICETVNDIDLAVFLEDAPNNVPLPDAGALIVRIDEAMGLRKAQAAVQRRQATIPFAIDHRHKDGSQTELLASDVPTKRTMTQTQDRLMRAALGVIIQLIDSFVATGQFAPNDAAANTPAPDQTADPSSSGLGYGTAVLRDFSAIARRRLTRKQMRWSVGYLHSDWQTADLTSLTEIPNPPGRFLADPFVVTHEGQTAILLEDLHYSDNRGRISAVMLDTDSQTQPPEIIPDILDEPFHLSFPYPFTHNGKLYMIPETGSANAIRLYECTRFPDQWVYSHDLIPDIASVDTMVFENEGTWWMLTNTAPPGTQEFALQTMLWRADDPINGPWVPHGANPVATGAAQARNGGLLRDTNGAWVRVRQRQGFNLYGAGASLARIESLAPHYRETKLRDIAPDFLPDICGTHHMHSNGAVTVMDFVRETHIR